MIKIAVALGDKLLARLVPNEEAAAKSCGAWYQCEYFGTHSRLILHTTSCGVQYICSDCC